MMIKNELKIKKNIKKRESEKKWKLKKILDQSHTQEWFVMKIEKKIRNKTSNFEKIQIKKIEQKREETEKVRNEKT